jgi:hypothetical protein
MHYCCARAPSSVEKAQLNASPKKRTRGKRECAAGGGSEDQPDFSIVGLEFDAPFMCVLITRCAALAGNVKDFVIGLRLALRVERALRSLQCWRLRRNRPAKADDCSPAHSRARGTPAREPERPSHHWSRRPKRPCGRVHEMRLPSSRLRGRVSRFRSSDSKGHSQAYNSSVLFGFDVPVQACRTTVGSSNPPH